MQTLRGRMFALVAATILLALVLGTLIGELLGLERGIDAWGNKLSVTGSLATTIGVENPFRYRGYYFDTETGLYYLNSRYYNPQWGRFLKADWRLALKQRVD